VRAWCDERGGLHAVLRQIGVMAARLCDQEEREADPTISKRRAVIIGPRHQSISGLARDPAAGSAKGANGKSGGKRSRTELHLEKQAAEVTARLGHIMPPQAGQEASGMWMHGVVQRYDNRNKDGIVALGGAASGLHLSFGGPEIMKAGITTLHPSQAVECLVVKRPDGSFMVTEIRLSFGERAAQLAEQERQAEAAEENYRIELMRRRVQ
jgi:hypothetical protein